MRLIPYLSFRLLISLLMTLLTLSSYRSNIGILHLALISHVSYSKCRIMVSKMLQKNLQSHSTTAVFNLLKDDIIMTRFIAIAFVVLNAVFFSARIGTSLFGQIYCIRIGFSSPLHSSTSPFLGKETKKAIESLNPRLGRRTQTLIDGVRLLVSPFRNLYATNFRTETAYSNSRSEKDSTDVDFRKRSNELLR